MRNSIARLGLLSLLGACTVAGVLIACSDDDNATSNTADSGTSETGTIDSGGGTDSGTTDSGPKAQPAKLTVLNAATNMGPDDPTGRIYFCFAISAAGANDFSVTPLPPLPDIDMGLPAGAGGYQKSTSGVRIETLDAQPYIINADKLSPAPDGGFPAGGGDAGTRADCDKLIGATGTGGTLTPNVDYWKLPVLPAGTLKDDHSYLLALRGCVQNTTVAGGEVTAQCGTTFNTSGGTAAGPGNLSVTAFELSMAGAPDGGIGAQYIQLSPSYAADVSYAVHNPGLWPADAGTDASDYQRVTPSDAVFTYPMAAATPPVSVTNFTADSTFAPTPLAPPGASRVPLSTLSLYSGGTVFTAGHNYIFLYEGRYPPNPGTQGSAAFHPLAFDTNP